MNSYCKVATSTSVGVILLINIYQNCCVARLFVFRSIYSEVYAFTPCLTISRGKRVSVLQMAKSGWSILVDAADLEVMLVVLEFPHHKYLLIKV